MSASIGSPANFPSTSRSETGSKMYRSPSTKLGRGVMAWVWSGYRLYPIAIRPVAFEESSRAIMRCVFTSIGGSSPPLVTNSR